MGCLSAGEGGIEAALKVKRAIIFLKGMKNLSSRIKNNYLWILVLLLVLLLWWHFRADSFGGMSAADMETDRIAQIDMDPDDILVDLNDSVSDAGIRAIENRYGIKLELLSAQSADERLYRVHTTVGAQRALIKALRNEPAVDIVEPDAMVHVGPSEAFLQFKKHSGEKNDPKWEGFPNDPQYKYQWHMRQINMPEAWKLGDGDGVVVAVIDTGVAHENYEQFHLVPDLDGVEFVKPYNFVHNNTHAGDDHGHGTHVAGTVAQVTHNEVGVSGVARKAKIMPLKVLSAGGSGSVGAIADAIHYAADEGAQVINMSLGGRRICT